MEVVWLAIALPLLSFAYCALLGWRLPRAIAGWVAAAAVGLAFLVGVLVLLDLLGRPPEQQWADVRLGNWIAAGDLTVRVGLLVDPLSALLLLVVTGVGGLIFVYATAYMRGDPGYVRFFAYMSLFVAAMLTLVLADNFALLLLGWGGVGLCSYLLIAFWFERPEAARAGVKAFVVNAVGDVGLLLAAFLTFTTFRTLDYDVVFSAAPQVLGEGHGTATAIALLLLLAAVAKSAQLPLYGWLPDAMAGPTPVSALIHAATMVAAGVYLIVRTHPLFVLSPTAMAVAAGVGTVTAVFAASAALVKPNVKRVLAYSTVSQLGYMFLGVGVGGFTAGTFHLVNHAFFKALLFLAAGGVIHALAGEEDLQKMGGLRPHLPAVYGTFLAGALALAGVPLFSGFFSKDEIVAAAFTSPRGGALWGVLALLAAGLTAFYVFRAFFLAFHGKPRPTNGAANHLHRPGAAMVLPLLALAGLAALAGYLQFPGLAFERYLAPVFARYGAPELVTTDFGPTYLGVAVASTLATALGIGLAYLLYAVENPLPHRLAYQLGGLHRLLLNDYYFEALLDLVFVRPTRWLAATLAGPVDAGVVDGAVSAVGRLTRRLGAGLAALESGYVRSYALVFLVGAVVLLAYLVRSGG